MHVSLFQVQSIEAKLDCLLDTTSRCCGKAQLDLALAPFPSPPANVNRRRDYQSLATAGTCRARRWRRPALGQRGPGAGLQLILAPGELGAQALYATAPRRCRRPGARETARRPRAAWRPRRQARPAGGPRHPADPGGAAGARAAAPRPRRSPGGAPRAQRPPGRRQGPPPGQGALPAPEPGPGRGGPAVGPARGAPGPGPRRCRRRTWPCPPRTWTQLSGSESSGSRGSQEFYPKWRGIQVVYQ